MFNYPSKGRAPVVEAILARYLQEYSTNGSLLSVSSSLFMSSVEVRLCAGDAAFNAINNIDGGTDLSGLLMTCPVFSLTLNLIS